MKHLGQAIADLLPAEAFPNPAARAEFVARAGEVLHRRFVEASENRDVMQLTAIATMEANRNYAPPTAFAVSLVTFCVLACGIDLKDAEAMLDKIEAERAAIAAAAAAAGS
jgi:hypothetical protein